jgi:hypothetical protein
MNEVRQFTFSFCPSDTPVIIRKFPYDILLPPRTDILCLEVKTKKTTITFDFTGKILLLQPLKF